MGVGGKESARVHCVVPTMSMLYDKSPPRCLCGCGREGICQSALCGTHSANALGPFIFKVSVWVSGCRRVCCQAGWVYEWVGAEGAVLDPCSWGSLRRAKSAMADLAALSMGERMGGAKSAVCGASSASALEQVASRVFVWVWVGRGLPECIVWYPQCECFRASRLQGVCVGVGW